MTDATSTVLPGSPVKMSGVSTEFMACAASLKLINGTCALALKTCERLGRTDARAPQKAAAEGFNEEPRARGQRGGGAAAERTRGPLQGSLDERARFEQAAATRSFFNFARVAAEWLLLACIFFQESFWTVRAREHYIPM